MELRKWPKLAAFILFRQNPNKFVRNRPPVFINCLIGAQPCPFKYMLSIPAFTYNDRIK